MDTAPVELRQKLLELAVANERVSAHERNVEWPVLVDKGKNAPHQLIALEIGELA